MFVNITFYGQDVETNTTAEYNDNVNTSNNFTKINLFNIDYNGEKIPIALTYSHDGIKVNEKSNSSLGIKWKIENIGYIDRTINYLNDNSPRGWFNTQNPDFSSSIHGFRCDETVDCYGVNSFHGDDLSPDFFSLTIANGNHFDFLYKKNIQGGVVGVPIPEFISNPNGYKINTNFNNFYAIGNSIVFNIQDKRGNNYDFVNGPALYDQRRAFQDLVRNNYYLKSISNPNNSDFINIDYITNGKMQSNYSAFGYYCNWVNQVCPNLNLSDYLTNMRPNESFIDKTRFDFKKIITNKEVINFIYTANNENLDEISISDLNGNYISGYKFEYLDFCMNYNAYTDVEIPKSLFKIKKYDKNHNQTQTIYEFEYEECTGYSHFGLDDIVWAEQYEDHFGYFNNMQKSSLLPFPSTEGCTILPAGNFEPDLYWCKQFSLKKIKNIFSGITEFDYQLNQGIDDEWGNLYGGGLVISSKKKIPLIGKTMLTKYDYNNLSGLVIKTNYLYQHYLSLQYSWFTTYSSMPKLREAFDTHFTQEFATNHKSGNFFTKVTESLYDVDNMILESSIVKEYVINTEGFFRTPLLKKETYKNSLNQDVKVTEYLYDYQNMLTFDSAEYRVENVDDGYMIFNKTFSPIYINRVNLTSVKEETFSNNGSITNNTTLNYINSNSKLLRSKIRTSAFGDSIEEKYYYPGDSQVVSSEPFVTDLIANNIIGSPIKTEIYKNNEKLSEEKIVYAKDATTNNLLAPKYVYAKKGTDANSALEKKITYDLYDDKGNILQYTQENGTPISLIWGYNKTQLLAKIENATYTSITASLISSAQAASDTGTETSLITALNSIRNSAPLANAMVTSYTHKPLIGISTTTDPKGYTMSYNYDTFGRLLNVKDASGNIIEEKEYHLIPQI